MKEAPQPSTHFTILDDDPFPSLLPALLLLLGALCGGLRSLLVSPLRESLTASLPPAWQQRASRAALAPQPFSSVAALLRALFVGSAAAIVALGGLGADSLPRAFYYAGAALVAALLVEGVPALVRGGRMRRLCLAALPLVRACSVILAPLALLLHRLVTALGGRTNHEESRRLAASLGRIAHDHVRAETPDESTAKMIGRLLELPHADSATLMTPRTELTAMPLDASVAEALELAAEAGHSRIPAFEEDHDHVVGVFHIKDVLAKLSADPTVAQEPVGSHMRKPFFVPETTHVPDLLEEMRRRREHLAVVVDEYGGTAGVITIEDLLEGIVGEIQDEHDSAEDIPRVYHADQHGVIADGRLPIQQLNEEYGFELPQDEAYETLAGLIFDHLGRIPAVGEKLILEDAVLEVLLADDRRVQRVRICPTRSAGESDAA